MNLREWALPVYTILIQMAVGMLLVLWVLRHFWHGKYKLGMVEHVVRDPLLIILTTIVLGMLGAHFHLSKPWLSFLAVRNFRSSWLSREIVFTLLFSLTTAVLWYLQWYRRGGWKLKTALGWLAIALGFITVYCMGRIYILPTQAAWDTPETIPAYFGSVLILGVMAIAAILVMDLGFSEVRLNRAMTGSRLLVHEAVRRLAVAALVILVPVLLVNLYHLYALRTGTVLAQTSYDLLMDLYQPLLIARFSMLLIGVAYLFVPIILMKRTGKEIQELLTPAYLACLLVIIGEVLGRFLFYAAHIRIGL
jgi:anaerobic dimethyl sulfoxide reductase subunit C (anchor subunit)